MNYAARQINTPSRVVVVAFLAVILVGTALLSLPISVAEGEEASWVSALFTATSAVCVTGLAVHDTAAHWTVFGEVVILTLIQIGGIGIMSLASILAVIVSGKLGLRARLNTQAETKTLGPGDVRQVIVGVVKITLLAEAVTAAFLTVRFMTGYGEPFGRALYYGIFHSVSAFTNAGFALWPDSIMRFVDDVWICLPLALAVVAGGWASPSTPSCARTGGGPPDGRCTPRSPWGRPRSCCSAAPWRSRSWSGTTRRRSVLSLPACGSWPGSSTAR
nr:hypothetical protein GCM10020093_114760 [Planobispora longispora]